MVKIFCVNNFYPNKIFFIFIKTFEYGYDGTLKDWHGSLISQFYLYLTIFWILNRFSGITISEVLNISPCSHNRFRLDICSFFFKYLVPFFLKFYLKKFIEKAIFKNIE